MGESTTRGTRIESIFFDERAPSNQLQGDSMARRIKELDRSDPIKVDLAEMVTRIDATFWIRVARTLLVINTLFLSYTVISTGRMHWALVVLCATIVIAFLVFQTKIIGFFLGLRHKLGAPSG